MLFYRAILLILSTVIIVAAADVRAETAEQAVYRGIAARLELMQPVAAWKLENGAPVEDLAREQIVLENAAADAGAAGLDAATTLPFIQAQMDAAKEIQECWMLRWQAGETIPSPVPDLVNDIRPKLLEIGGGQLGDIEAALASGANFDANQAEAFAAAVDPDCLSHSSRERIFQELSRLQLAQ
ncbi:MAG: gamma subclass chorismate mutase AroQ [Pseudomonadota bacterium]